MGAERVSSVTCSIGARHPRDALEGLVERYVGVQYPYEGITLYLLMNINLSQREVKCYFWYLYTPTRVVATLDLQRHRRPFLPILAPCQPPCRAGSTVSVHQYHSFPRRFLSFGSVSTPSASRKFMSIPSLFSRSVSFKTQYLFDWERKKQVRQTLCAVPQEKSREGWSVDRSRR